MESALDEARAAFANQEWRRACDAYSIALTEGELSAADFQRQAIAAHLVGEDATSDKAWEDAARTALEGGDRSTAALCAFWHGLLLLLRGQSAKAGGWLSRASTLVEEAAPEECSAAGFLLIPRLLGVLRDDPAAARDLALRAIEVGTRRKDPDLRAFGMLGHGQALIAMGEIGAGVARLDEVMVAVTAGEVGPMATGIVYCAVILECMALFDFARASEWTDALDSWCDMQPGLVPLRGQCLVHRSQLKQTTGAWSEAAATADAACDRLSDPLHPALGLARYQCGELRRLLGDFAGAEAAYREASRLGQDPMPGLALLELMRGDTAAATASIRRALHDTTTAKARPLLLAAAVEILRADGDIASARAAVDELNAIAASSTSAVLKAMATHSTGAVLVAEGEPAAALVPLRTATRTWQDLRMPYEGARTAVVVGLACAALGDRKTADLEFANARQVFDRLGALPDLRRVDTLATPSTRFKGLSEREREVLAHLAAGKTNSEIADELVISLHTVRRHVEHIFTKLGVSTRAAATAYAHQRGLLSPHE